MAPGGDSNEDLFEVVLAFKRFGRVGPVTGTGASPDLLEDDASQQSANHRTGEADRPVEDPLAKTSGAAAAGRC